MLFCGLVSIVDMKTMKAQQSVITVVRYEMMTLVILAIIKTQKTSFLMIKASNNCGRFPDETGKKQLSVRKMLPFISFAD